MTQHDALGDAAKLAAVLTKLAGTIDARAGADPGQSWTARLLLAGPGACAKKLGEEAVEAALAVVSQSDVEVAGEAGDVIYHLLVALRSRGVTLDQVAERLEARQGQSGLDEKAGRKPQ
jgi:phosphoribosyl-ATP pyrophosphohydrolase